MTGKGRRRAAALLAAIMVLGQPVLFSGTAGSGNMAYADQTASTMRLAKTEGTVEVSAAGKKLTILEEMKLHSGYTVSTGEKSYAGISLDDEKAVKIDALSEAEVRKKGKKLELLLNSGSLLCDVKQPLDGDETLNIRTSTMITGIRGTVLYVKIIDKFTTVVYMLEGHAVLQGINPMSGMTEEVVITAGQSAAVTVVENGVSGDGLTDPRFPEIVVNPFEVTDIPGYVLAAVAQDLVLAARLSAAGWDTQWMIQQAARRLAEDEAAAAAELERLKAANLNGQTQSRDYVFQDSGDESRDNSGDDAGNNSGDDAGDGSGDNSGDDAGDDSGDNSGNESGDNSGNDAGNESGDNSGNDAGDGSGDNSGDDGDINSKPEPIRDTVILEQLITSIQLNELLADKDVVLDIPYQEGGDPLDLLGDQDITIPAGGRLELSEGVILRMEEGTSLTIDGTLKTAGSLYSDGIIRNQSRNTLNVGKELVIGGELENTGSIRVGEAMFLETGSCINQGGQIEIGGFCYIYQAEFDSLNGTVTVGGSMEIYAGSKAELGKRVTIGGEMMLAEADCSIRGAVCKSGIKAVASKLLMTGGTVFSAEDGCGIAGESGSEIQLLGGTVYGTAGGAAVRLSDSSVYLAANVLRAEDETVPFVSGTGNLTFNLGGESCMYDLETMPEGIFVGKETEDGWLLTGFRETDKGTEEATPSSARRS